MHLIHHHSLAGEIGSQQMHAPSFAHGIIPRNVFDVQGQHNPASPFSVWLECLGKKLTQAVLKAASDRQHNLSLGSRCFSVAWPVASTATTYSTPLTKLGPIGNRTVAIVSLLTWPIVRLTTDQSAYSISQADPAD
jgi:hypothetical protein